MRRDRIGLLAALVSFLAAFVATLVSYSDPSRPAITAARAERSVATTSARAPAASPRSAPNALEVRSVERQAVRGAPAGASPISRASTPARSTVPVKSVPAVGSAVRPRKKYTDATARRYGI